MKKKAFTLIELIAVLVILAILALIVTPLVMNIIRKARVSADKRSIDAYGRSIELAIASYLLDEGKFPTSIDELSIEYTGDEVVCSTTQLNSDSLIYLAGCTVAGRSVDGYTYGKEEIITYDTYEVGDELTYNNVDYYVIADSGATESTVTLLKAEPLTVDEVNLYGTGRVNKYTNESFGTAYNVNGYGGMQYYGSSTCFYHGEEAGCKSDYESSDIKYVVDSWANEKIPSGLVEARLLQLNEIKSFGYEEGNLTPSDFGMLKTDSVPNWICSRYWYWTMIPYADSNLTVWSIFKNAEKSIVNCYDGVVRPVIVISKSALQS